MPTAGVIQNSELAHMGYDGEKEGLFTRGTAANILIRNNDFHHWWYAFYYSAGSRNVTIDNNEYHDNYMYKIDPHSGTSDMNITKTTMSITTDTTELFVLRTALIS